MRSPGEALSTEPQKKKFHMRDRVRVSNRNTTRRIQFPLVMADQMSRTQKTKPTRGFTGDELSGNNVTSRTALGCRDTPSMLSVREAYGEGGTKCCVQFPPSETKKLVVVKDVSGRQKRAPEGRMRGDLESTKCRESKWKSNPSQ